MKLFLSGGGSGENSIKLDKKFVKELDLTKPLLYIPIAMQGDHSYSSCFEWISKTFNPLGVNKIEMWTEKEIAGSSEEELNKFSGIYIGGGNTFYLLKEFKELGFISKLINIAKTDFPIYGGSAGAIIFGKSIIPALSADPNHVNLNDFNGVNFVKEYSLWCHYKTHMDSEIKKYIENYKLDIIAIPENAGLYVSKKSIDAIGPGNIRYFNQKF